jgi:hypothetical protein
MSDKMVPLNAEEISDSEALWYDSEQARQLPAAPHCTKARLWGAASVRSFGATQKIKPFFDLTKRNKFKNILHEIKNN